LTKLEQIAEFVCGSQMTVLNAEERAALRAHAADSAIALVAGASSPEGRHLVGLLGAGASPAEQAGVAAAIIRSTEVDDIHIEACVTPTSVAMPAALLTGRVDLGEAEDAVRIAVELSVRMGLAIEGPSALYRGVWPTCFSTPFAVAAAMCRMHLLDRVRTVHALSIALMTSSGRIGRFAGQPTGRWIVLNAAFANGVRAYEAGARGYKGDPALLEGPWLQNVIGAAPKVDALTHDLSRSRAMPGLGMKPFSTARQALAPTQALQELLVEGLDPHAIDSICVRVPEAYAAMISRPLEPFRSSGYANAGFQMALAALKPAHLFDLDRSSVMSDPKLLAFARKVQVEAHAGLQKDYPRVWAAEIEVRCPAQVLRRKVISPRGDSANRLSSQELAAKGASLLKGALAPVEAERVARILTRTLEEPQPAVGLMRQSLV
jgi:2-methylcitrate dehydratase PrpD